MCLLRSFQNVGQPDNSECERGYLSHRACNFDACTYSKLEIGQGATEARLNAKAWPDCRNRLRPRKPNFITKGARFNVTDLLPLVQANLGQLRSESLQCTTSTTTLREVLLWTRILHHRSILDLSKLVNFRTVKTVMSWCTESVLRSWKTRAMF